MHRPLRHGYDGGAPGGADAADESEYHLAAALTAEEVLTKVELLALEYVHTPVDLDLKLPALPLKGRASAVFAGNAFRVPVAGPVGAKQRASPTPA